MMLMSMLMLGMMCIWNVCPIQLPADVTLVVLGVDEHIALVDQDLIEVVAEVRNAPVG